jgi:hydroxyethylthiazole kinase-like uncharacterized protein yjeF
MSDVEVVTSRVLRRWALPQVGEAGGKDARGSIVVLGGAVDTPGAVLLAGIAALRTGAGKLTIATVEPAATALAVAVPESAVTALPTTGGRLDEAAVDAAAGLVDGADAVVLGPGMRGPDATRRFVAGLLPRVGADTVVVLDAMALTCGAVTREVCAALPAGVVATPNAKEASRLLGGAVEGRGDVDAGVARRLAAQLGVVAAVTSYVATPDGRCWVDGSGNSGLGTSGSGDVLAGVVGGLAARGAAPEQAAVWGVHVHAEAGERLAARIGRVGYLARELLDEVPSVVTQLESAG